MDVGKKNNERPHKDDAGRTLSDTGVSGIELPGEPANEDGTIHVPKLGGVPETDLPPRTDSILSDQDHVFDVSGAFEGKQEAGMILRDKRKKRRSILRTAKKAFDEWWGETEQSLKGIKLFQKKKRPTVAPGTKRKDVVTRAAQMAKRVPHGDHTVVVEKLRTLKNDAEEVSGKPYILKEQSEHTESKGQWSHYAGNENEEYKTASHPHDHKTLTPSATAHTTAAEKTDPETGSTPSQQDAKPAPSPVLKQERKPQQSIPPKQPSDQVRETERQAPPQKPEPEPAHQEPKPRWSFFRNPKEEEVEPEPEFIPSFEERERAQAYQMPTFEEVASKQSRTYRGDAVEEIAEKKLTAPQIAARERSRAPSTTLKRTVQTRSANQLLILVVVTLIILGGIGTAGYFIFRGSDESGTGTPGIPAFMRVQDTRSVAMSNDPEALLRALRDSVASGPTGLSHVYVALPSAGESVTTGATTADIFAVIEPRAPDTFIRSLDERHMFGGYRQSGTDPFLILKTDTFDVAFAGMLSWEPYIAEDLGAFFGTGSVRGKFTDTAVRNTNVRVLRDERGDARLLYAFVNRNTLVITTSSEALRVIEDAMR